MPVQFTTAPLPINLGERHIPVVIFVDIPSSMIGDSITELSRGLSKSGIALAEDSLAMRRAEVRIISFNSSIQTEMEICPATQYQAPTLSAGGGTFLNEAIETGLDAIESKKVVYMPMEIGVNADTKKLQEYYSEATKAKLVLKRCESF